MRIDKQKLKEWITSASYLLDELKSENTGWVTEEFVNLSKKIFKEEPKI